MLGEEMGKIVDSMCHFEACETAAPPEQHHENLEWLLKMFRFRGACGQKGAQLAVSNLNP